MVMVPINCFLGNTSYSNQFIEISNPVKMEPIMPANLNRGGQKFKAESMYKAEFNSSYHQQEASGPVLQAKTQEQRSKTNDYGIQQRQGTLSRQPLKFMGESHYQATSKLAESPAKVKTFKPIDTLFCLPAKMLGKSQSKSTYDGQTIEICKY